MRTIVTAVIALVLASGCTRTYISVPSTPSPVTPPATVTSAKIEFRASGNATSVRVRYTNERDGQVQTVTTLPFFTTFTSTADNLFLNFEVTPITFSALTQFPFVSAQIFVNGDLFREASSNDWFLYTLSVSGTWRR